MLTLKGGASVDENAIGAALLDRAAGILDKVVVYGEGKDYLAILAWPSPKGCTEIAGGEMSIGALSVADVVREHVRDVVRIWNKENPKQKVTRTLLVGDAADSHTFESDLYAEPAAAGTIVLG